MNKNLKQYASNNSLDFYFNATNIRNQELVQDTFNHFTNGPRKGVFNSLDFLNLLDKQNKFIDENVTESDFVLAELRAIPLSKLERHILFGFILKWYGGYPVNNLDEDYDRSLKLIEKEFLSYPEVTPEKEFCKVDINFKKYLMKLGIAGTTAINTGVSLLKLMEGFEQKNDNIGCQNFDELFEDAVRNNLFGVFVNEEEKLIFRTKCNYDFNVWLNENKSWDLISVYEYKKHLTKDCFLQFFEEWGKIPITQKANDENLDKGVWIGKSIKDTDHFERVADNPQKFEDVFAVTDFKKYISVFEKTKPALLNSNWQFIGNPKKHKGVICSWIRDLQLQSVIKLNISRSELAQVLNNELQDLNLGKDGKTLHNLSAVYKKEFKGQIETLLDMN